MRLSHEDNKRCSTEHLHNKARQQRVGWQAPDDESLPRGKACYTQGSRRDVRSVHKMLCIRAA